MSGLGRVVPVILCGGGGTRLWPLSTAEKPKQFHALAGETSLLQQTVARVSDRGLFSPPLIVAGISQSTLVAEQLGDPGADSYRLILEPVARDSAAAIALAVVASHPDDVLLVMPSDHAIGNRGAFLSAIRNALTGLANGRIVIFGITPEYPATGYGYIAAGDVIAPGVHGARGFVEKPDLARAENLLAAGQHLWNAGIFFARAADFASAFEANAADVIAAARNSLSDAGAAVMRPDGAPLDVVRAISFDRAVMEKAGDVAVVPVDMAWTDLGSWDAVADYRSGNASGPVTADDCTSCLILSDGPEVVAIGLQDLVIVAHGGRFLVTAKGRADALKTVLAAAAENRREP
ncbi:mannose-1-phosphate guanylyltransferase [Allosphingosinicella indica]|uniref:Mannose-1-phosphate guanylyltransferase/mannose-1-phosphate guanylyltransferase / mannose-6-phosphate isomerase n=1 Tax=Allosphingosinicella indica TaxID=941907 RepID=A0A1X7G1J8_9SPHN|nr:mannose-1-phosphate guanylyltransferase [Allosphingosinicella indica]SMF62334.1 mannose-1-phosphate guanylyltransferase/mannose-1-phosphate guanylyltransferase / mannose-6-phosphate isomerase [Allosphingosinicella indica]